MSAALVGYLMRLGDDALITAQRLGSWTARAPEMEEDIALTNIALDQLGAARALLTYAGELEGQGRDEDALAYLRSDAEYRNAQLAELADADFAYTIVKLLLLSAYQHPLYEALAGGTDERLAAIAAKAVKESAYHLDHAAQWTVRLGDGTPESHRRMTEALDALWPYADELFTHDDVVSEMVAAGIAPDPDALRERWTETVTGVLSVATLAAPDTAWRPSGGRSGQHTEALSYLLTEMQVLHRAHPGATW